MIFAMSCISLLGSVVWGHHMYSVGLETDTRAYFSGVTILISLPTGTKIFNWLSTYLGPGNRLLDQKLKAVNYRSIG
jgi:cytochrome c oxidase subunit 1